MFLSLFNFIARLFGYGLLFVGFILELSNLVQFFNDGSQFNQDHDMVEKLFLVTFPLILMFLGWLTIKAKVSRKL